MTGATLNLCAGRSACCAGCCYYDYECCCCGRSLGNKRCILDGRVPTGDRRRCTHLAIIKGLPLRWRCSVSLPHNKNRGLASLQTGCAQGDRWSFVTCNSGWSGQPPRYVL